MANEAIEEFVRRLLRATEQGTLKWDLQGTTDFIAKAGKGSVRIGGGPQATVLEVRNVMDQTLETLEADPERPGAWLPWEETLHRLWEEARLSAFGTTEIIKELSAEWELPPDPHAPKPPPAEDDIPF